MYASRGIHLGLGKAGVYFSPGSYSATIPRLRIGVRTEPSCFLLGDSMAWWSQGKTSVTKFKPQAKPQVPIEPVSCLGCCSCLAAAVFSAGSNIPEDGRAWALTALAYFVTAV